MILVQILREVQVSTSIAKVVNSEIRIKLHHSTDANSILATMFNFVELTPKPRPGWARVWLCY